MGLRFPGGKRLLTAHSIELNAVRHSADSQSCAKGVLLLAVAPEGERQWGALVSGLAIIASYDLAALGLFFFFLLCLFLFIYLFIYLFRAGEGQRENPKQALPEQSSTRGLIS